MLKSITQETSLNGNNSLNSLLPSDSTPLPNTTLSETDRDMAIALITQLRNQLPLKDVKASDRRSLAGMGDKNRIFVTKVVEVITQNPDFLPRSFDADQLRQSLASFERLENILMALNQLRDLVDATAITLGSEAYNQARIAYRYAKASDQGANLEAIVGDMGQRYSRKTKKPKTSAAPEAVS